MPAATNKSFRPGGCDIFTYPQMPYVGDPFRMRVFTDGAGLFAGWHLRSVAMREVLHTLLCLILPNITSKVLLNDLWTLDALQALHIKHLNNQVEYVVNCEIKQTSLM